MSDARNNCQGEDWALVVGIANYPHFGPEPDQPNNLQGPINDAKDVEQVLRESYGVKHIKLLTSDGEDGGPWPDEKPHPIKGEIEQWFRDLVLISLKNVQDGLGRKIGRRVYIYLAGHGVAPARNQRALVTAESLCRPTIDHFLATSWVEHFCNTGYFDEYVLWMDCCTQARVTLIPTLPPFNITQPLQPQPPTMMVCAAKYPYDAIELPLGPSKEYRGVFTFELTKGLRGAAANPETGGIRSRDLRGFLYNAIRNRIEALSDKTNISLEPEFLTNDDEDIIFKATDEAPPPSKQRKMKVALPDGTKVSLLNNKFKTIDRLTVAQGMIVRPLPPGLYKLVAGNLSWLFEVSDEETINVCP